MWQQSFDYVVILRKGNSVSKPLSLTIKLIVLKVYLLVLFSYIK